MVRNKRQFDHSGPRQSRTWRCIREAPASPRESAQVGQRPLEGLDAGTARRVKHGSESAASRRA